MRISAHERAQRRAAFIAGLMVRLLVAALFVRAAFWFVQTWVAQNADFKYIANGTIAAVGLLYVLGFIGYRLERTVRNDLLDAASLNPDSDSPASSSPFAKRD